MLRNIFNRPGFICQYHALSRLLSTHEAWLLTADSGHDMPCPGGKVLSHAGVTVAAWEGVTVLMELYVARESTGMVRVKQELCDLEDGVTGWKVLDRLGLDNLDTCAISSDFA